MSIHEINNQPSKIRRIPREVVEAKALDPRRSEWSLLEILIQRNPDRAKVIIDGLKSSCKPHSVVV